MVRESWRITVKGGGVCQKDKNKMSEMKPIWCGGVCTRKEKQRKRLGGQRWRVHLIYVACVRDNRKVKGYSRGLKGGGERKQRERDRVKKH